MVATTRSKSEERFQEYLSGLTGAVGHADRTDRLHAYCTGLLLPGDRKSVEPRAWIRSTFRPCIRPSLHQALHHFVAVAPWNDQAVLAAVREQVLPALIRQGPITAWIIDDTAFSKKGKHSVGVARQYCGHLGKTDNCQVAVSLSVANAVASLPVAFRLYLPEDWANDFRRRAKAGVPDEVTFQTKPQIALEQIRQTLACGVAPGVVLADAGCRCRLWHRYGVPNRTHGPEPAVCAGGAVLDAGLAARARTAAAEAMVRAGATAVSAAA